MEQEFSFSKGWKIFTYLFCIAIIGVMFYLLLDAVSSGKDISLWVGLNVLTILLFGYVILSAYRSKTVLSSDRIIQYGAFREKSLLFSEVKGIRIKPKNTIILSNTPGRSNIMIGDISYIKNGGELMVLLQNKFPNIDQVEYNDELTEALHDPALGTSVADRKQRLADVSKIASYLNWAGFAVALWVFVYPHPYQLAVVVGLVYPLIVMIYFFKQQEVIVLIDSDKKSVYPSLNLALVFPPGGLFVRVLVDYTLLYLKDCIIPIAVLFIVLGLIFLLFIRPSKNKITNLCMTLFFSLLYSVGAIVMVNCTFDSSKSTEYKTKVLDQHISSGRSTTYYLTLDGWGPRKEQEDESVPHSVYNQVKKGDVVTVYVKRGYLHIPWYFVDL